MLTVLRDSVHGWNLSGLGHGLVLGHCDSLDGIVRDRLDRGVVDSLAGLGGVAILGCLAISNQSWYGGGDPKKGKGGSEELHVDVLLS